VTTLHSCQAIDSIAIIGRHFVVVTCLGNAHNLKVVDSNPLPFLPLTNGATRVATKVVAELKTYLFGII